MSLTEQLCLSCGLCCDGTIFANVALQPTEKPGRLNSLGVPLKQLRGGWVLSQPCSAFDGCRCRIYASRPVYCEKFECWLFKEVSAGKLSGTTALRVIRQAKVKASRARRLLEQLGDTNYELPLAARFRRTSRRLEKGPLDQRATGLFGKLTNLMQQLNVLLSGKFYPATGGLPYSKGDSMVQYD